MARGHIVDAGNPASESSGRRLLVMLPGAEMHARDFRGFGFVDAARQAGYTGDIVAADTGVDDYLDDRTSELLHEEIVKPARERGVATIWLVGISLGGMGALLYAQALRPLIDGIVLLAPFIGTRGLVAEAVAAGGLRQWRTPDESTAERKVMAWLGRYDGNERDWPRLILAYGTEDRFAAGHRLLADLLPPDRVLTSCGGHDWPTWTGLWQEILRAAPFAVS
jgi:pimeloyl-ACP methyl ester carboxylesterase